MSRIVLGQEEVIVILMPGKIGHRRLQVENLIERGLGSGHAPGKFFDPRTYPVERFSSSHCVRTQSSRLSGNRLITKVLRRMPGFRYGGIVRAGIEFCHQEVDLVTAQKFRDNAEPPFLERSGDCLEISHACCSPCACEFRSDPRHPAGWGPAGLAARRRTCWCPTQR